MERADRIKKAYEYLRYQGLVETQDDVADKMNRQRSNVSSALNGNPKYLTEKFINAFCKTFKIINPDWLLTGEGNMLVGDVKGGVNIVSGNKGSSDNIVIHGNNAYIGNNDAAPSKSYTKGKPYYNIDFIGGFDIVLNNQSITPDYLIDFQKYKDADCWCNITGHSMEPLISNGDIIAIKKMKEWKDFILYGEAYGIITEDLRTVKIITKSERGDDFLKLVPVNKSEEYQPQDIPKRLVTHVFKVLGCMKKL
ncbi:S24 family peptidase [Bacteroides pyogenes]|uniref:S24 family peptidase n=1 Tax=Bacteroides pyogenes TaxID=310300 RepID=UPI002FD8A354